MGEGILGRSMTAEISAMSDGEKPFLVGSEAEIDARLITVITMEAIERATTEIEKDRKGDEE